MNHSQRGQLTFLHNFFERASDVFSSVRFLKLFQVKHIAMKFKKKKKKCSPVPGNLLQDPFI